MQRPCRLRAIALKLCMIGPYFVFDDSEKAFPFFRKHYHLDPSGADAATFCGNGRCNGIAPVVDVFFFFWPRSG